MFTPVNSQMQEIMHTVLLYLYRLPADVDLKSSLS